MIKRPLVILALAVIGLIALATYISALPPQGVEAKGGVEAVSWISLAIAVLSFLTALAGLAKKLLELRDSARQ